MTAYTDIPQASALHAEAENVQRAIDMLSSGGTMSSFNVIPPPPDPETSAPLMMMVSVTVVDPLQQTTVDALVSSMQSRLNTINSELAALGVTGAPTA